MEYHQPRQEDPDRLHATNVVKELMSLRDCAFAEYRLNQRERQIANRLLDGETNALIAQHLFLSLSCVKYHTRNVYKKTGCANKTAFCETIHKGIDRRVSALSATGE